MGHRQIAGELPRQEGRQVPVEALDRLRIEGRPDPVAGADPAAPGLVTEAHVLRVAEALDRFEAAKVKPFDLFRVDPPASLLSVILAPL